MKDKDSMAYLVQNGQTLYFLDKEPEVKGQTFYQIKPSDGIASISEKIGFARDYTGAEWIMFNVGPSLGSGKPERLDTITTNGLKTKLKKWKEAWAEWSNA